MPRFSMETLKPFTQQIRESHLCHLRLKMTLRLRYFVSKVLALDATDRFQAKNQPHFSIVNIMPSFVIGKNELVRAATLVPAGSNGVVMSILLGQKSSTPRLRPTVHVQDVARVHVGVLDEQKVPEGRDFILAADQVPLDDAIGVVQQYFPEAIAKSLLPLGGSTPSVSTRLDVSDTIATFGAFKPFAEQVRDVVEQYVALKERAQ